MRRYPEQPSDTLKITATDVSMHCYRLYARRIHTLLYLGGVSQDYTRSVVQAYVTGFLVMFMSLSEMFFVMNFCWDYKDNLVILSKCLGLVSSFFSPFLMSCCFLAKRKKLHELHRTLNHLFEQELTRDQRTKKFILAYLHAFDRPSYALIIILVTTAIIYILPSIFSIIQSFISHSASTKPYKWPYPAKFPWLIPNGSLIFYLQYFYQISFLWWMVFTNSAVDSLFGFYAFQIVSVLRAMSIRLANPQSDEIFSIILKTCAKTHHKLQRCVYLLKDIYGLIILRAVITNAILMCALIFEVHPFTDMPFNRMCIFVSHMTSKVTQTFLYAWYGSLITNASENFREGVYFSKWLDSSLDRHVRTSVVLIMLQKPMVVTTALNIISVNINLFTNILNTTMSYFFLLQSLDEPK